MTSVVYAIPTVPTWNSVLVPYGFWTMSCVTGSLLMLATLAFAQKMGVSMPSRMLYLRAMLFLSASTLVASVLIFHMQNTELTQMRNAYGFASELVPWYGWAITGYGICGACGIMMVVLPVLRKGSLQPLVFLAPGDTSAAFAVPECVTSPHKAQSLHYYARPPHQIPSSALCAWHAEIV
jgi:DMSO reductase anchor subunit